jgi:primosomal protein N'
MKLKPNTEVIFDTTHTTELIEQLTKSQNLSNFIRNIFDNELQNRNRFNFPPFENIILITTQEKTQEKSLQKIQMAKNYLTQIKSSFPEIRISGYYEARFLKRKGMYSYHITVKYPKQYHKFLALKKYISFLIQKEKLQARINPRHLF